MLVMHPPHIWHLDSLYKPLPLFLSSPIEANRSGHLKANVIQIEADEVGQMTKTSSPVRNSPAKSLGTHHVLWYGTTPPHPHSISEPMSTCAALEPATPPSHVSISPVHELKVFTAPAVLYARHGSIRMAQKNQGSVPFYQGTCGVKVITHMHVLAQVTFHSSHANHFHYLQIKPPAFRPLKPYSVYCRTCDIAFERV